MKANYCKYLVCLPAFVLALLFFNPLTARAEIAISRSGSYSVSGHNGVLVGDEVVDEFRLDGFFVCDTAGYYNIIARLGTPSYTVNPDFGSQNVDWYVDNFRLVVNGVEIFLSNGISSNNLVFQGDIYLYSGGVHCEFVGDLHRRLYGNRESYYNTTERLSGSTTSTSSGSSVSTTTGTGTISGYTSTSTIYPGTISFAESPYPNGVTYIGDSFTVSDRVTQTYIQNQTSVIQSQTAQEHSDAQSALAESQRQTSALTEFSKASLMASDSANADSTVSSYKDAESSLVSGAQDGIKKFDYTSLFNFPVALTQSFMLVSTWLSALISQMGSFSLIFSIGAALSLALLFIGLWKFK